MAKYVKKPVVIDAWQFTKENFFNGVPEFIQEEIRKSKVIRLWSYDGGAKITGIIKTLEGDHTVTENDFIIKGVNGEFYPCKPDIFWKTYDEVKEEN